MNFGQVLRQLRESKELTQEELARRAGLNYMEISHYEAGRRKPGLDNILKLCDGLGCTPNQLLKPKGK